MALVPRDPSPRSADLRYLRIQISLVRRFSLIQTVLLLLAAPSALAITNIIGLLLPPEEPDAAEIRDGALLAIERANQFGSNRARLVIRGRVGQWGADGVEAGRMAIEDGAAALIAPPSGAATHLALQVAGRTGVPVVSLCPDSSVSQTGVPWMVRIAPSTVQEATALFQGLKPAGEAGPKRWLAVVPAGRSGREITGDLHTAASASRCSLLQIVEVSSPPTNLHAISSAIIEHRANATLVWLDACAAAEVVKSLRQGGFKGVLAGPGPLRSDEFTTKTGISSEGFVVPTIACDPSLTPLLNAFNEAWQKRFGRRATPIARYSYDAATLLMNLLQQTEPESLHRSFPLRAGFRGVSGELKFDEQGNRIASFQLQAVHKGHFIDYAP